MADQHKIKITQLKSIIDELENAKRTIKALKLGRPRSSVVVTDTPQIRGMINAVRHMVIVEEVK